MNPKLSLKIPDEVRAKVIEFVYSPDNAQYFVKNTAGGTSNRRYCLINKLDAPFAEFIKSFAKRAYEDIGILEFDEEPRFGNFIGVNSAGGNVHFHTDPAGDWGRHHLRINILVQKPIAGGIPILNGVEYKIEEGMAWINYASDWLHGSTMVMGERERIVLSLGSLVASASVAQLSKEIGWEFG